MWNLALPVRLLSLALFLGPAVLCQTNATAVDGWGRLRPSLELRGWAEEREGLAFGTQPDLSVLYVRTRFGLVWEARDWLRFGGMVQDARAPFYGRPAPGTAQDWADLHEAYVEFGRPKAAGWSGLAGRKRFRTSSMNWIGVPEWSNTGRTYDAAEIAYQGRYGHTRALFASIVKFRPEDFDKPVLGDRIYGLSHALSSGWEVIFLRHEQNRPGGFTGQGRLMTNSYGGRSVGSFRKYWTWEADALMQTGRIGALPHAAFGGNLAMTRKEMFGMGWESGFDVRYASGSSSRERSGTFDQLYPANHDRFGHADLLGFRNLTSLRWRNAVKAGRRSTVNLTWSENWVASTQDTLYDPAGRPLGVLPPPGTGRHIGGEAAIYTVHRFGFYQLGFGFAQWWLGEFARRATPGIVPRYFYVHQGISF